MLGSYEAFKKEVYRLTNIDLNCYKENQMRRRIDQLATKNKVISYEEYLKLIRHDKEMFEQFVNFLTINVSEFYRNPDQWKLLDETVIPKLLAEHGNHIKIWSAACSTGDEPYSLAMAFSKHIPLGNISITATDIDKQVLQQAQVGLYNAKSISGVPEEMKNRYFTKVGSSFQVADSLKNRITFQEHNLLNDPFPKDFDLILCRNVVIYFTDEAKDIIYRKFYQSLKPKGVLFIGNTEQISNYKDIGFRRMSSFYFEKGEKPEHEHGGIGHAGLFHEDAVHGGYAHPDAGHNGISHTGSFHEDAAHGGYAHPDAGHNGISHTGSFHEDAAHGGYAHSDAAHNGFLHTGLSHEDAVHGGYAHPDAAHNGFLHTGSAHEATTHGAYTHQDSVHGGFAHRENVHSAHVTEHVSHLDKTRTEHGLFHHDIKKDDSAY